MQYWFAASALPSVGILSEALVEPTRNFIVSPTGMSMGGRSDCRLDTLAQPFF
ncbi:MAG: hypothetical protein AAFN12_08880 [Cyanobacteria bacterium J06560_2]